jgi:hypothetical protein
MSSRTLGRRSVMDRSCPACGSLKARTPGCGVAARTGRSGPTRSNTTAFASFAATMAALFLQSLDTCLRQGRESAARKPSEVVFISHAGIVGANCLPIKLKALAKQPAPSRTANLNITSNIPVNCTNALRRKASFARPADDAWQHARAWRTGRSGKHRRQGSRRRLEPCVPRQGWLRRPLGLHSTILESGHAAVVELGCRQVNRHPRDQERGAANHHSEKSNAELRGHRNVRAAKDSAH